MKNEHFIFLVLILSAAIIAGSTAGIINNFESIANHLQQKQALASNDEDTPEVAKGENETSPPRQASVDTVSSGTSEYMVITDAEQQEIKNMLSTLGMKSGQDPAEFIRHFQKDHSLNATGNLDSQTLQLIINQSTRVQASRALANQTN
ncbi:peptidoglycan-binding domain-containing protein [Syntrophomonas erecta subsp. sporosyntropha]